MLADQEPPGVELLSTMVSPSHTLSVPLMEPADGSVLTVTGKVAFAVPHTFVTVYEIVTAPAATPDTMPEADPTVATEVLPELHDPPGAPSVSVSGVPTHTRVDPVMEPASGIGFTVIGNVAIEEPQILVTVYLIVSRPAAAPVTTPDVPTDAIETLLLLQAPPDVASARVIVEPTHTLVVPVIVPDTGNGLTVIGRVVEQPVGNV